MTYGYSQRLAEANKKADASSLGVKLGRQCIKNGISVNTVAKHIGVSRSTVYNWFWGINSPREQHADAILSLILKLKTSKK